MEKYDVKDKFDEEPDRGNFPRIGNSKYRFNLWYKFPKLIEKPKGEDGLIHHIDNYNGEYNFSSDKLIDYMRQSFSGIIFHEDFDRTDFWSLDPDDDKKRYEYRITTFIKERNIGCDAIYAQKYMKSFDEIDYQKSGEWIAKMLDDLGAELDEKAAIEQVECNQVLIESMIKTNTEIYEIISKNEKGNENDN